MKNLNIPEKGSSLPLPEVWIQKLMDCPQNPRYHAEGNVWAHTLLVLDKLYEFRDTLILSPEEERILYWACILHDIGKPMVTRIENERITAGGHEYAGVHIAREILLSESNLSAYERRQVLDLVRWHYVPFRWGTDHKTDAEYYQLAFRMNLRLMAAFSLLDFQGRICENQTQAVKMIENFYSITEPRIRYYTGSFKEIEKVFLAKDPLHKDAIWYALRKNDFSTVLKLMEAESMEGNINYKSEALFTWAVPGSGKTSWLHNNMPDIPVIQLRDFGLFAGEQDLFVIDRKIVEFKYHLDTIKRHFPKVVIEGDVFSEPLWTRLTEVCRRSRVVPSVLYLEPEGHNWKSRAADLYGYDSVQQWYFDFMQPHPMAFHSILHETIKNE